MTCKKEIEEKDKIISEMKTKFQGVHFKSTENKGYWEKSKTSEDNKNEIKTEKGPEWQWYIEGKGKDNPTHKYLKKKEKQISGLKLAFKITIQEGFPEKRWEPTR